MRHLWIVITVATIVGTGVAAGAEKAQQKATAKEKARVLEKKAAGKPTKAPPVAIKPPEAQAVDPAGKARLNDPITCLSRAIYWEARGDGTASMEAIANVVMNRLGHKGFPDTVCKVVKDGCQFSWWCDRRSDKASDDKSYTLAKEISRKALNRQLPDRTGGALYFHHRKVHPSWSKKYLKTVTISKFVFYKPRGGKAD